MDRSLPSMHLEAEGNEEFSLEIGGQSVAQYTVATQQQAYRYQSETSVTADQVRVVFTNDLFDPAAGIDRDLTVDSIEIDGSTFETEASDVFSTGSWVVDGIRPGFQQTEVLNANGYFQYGSATPPNPSVISLANSNISISEEQGNVSIGVDRTGGTNGIVSVDYQTFADTASSSDFDAVSGTLTFGDGETQQFVNVPIIDDSAFEDTETFNFVVDNVTGNGTLGAPRTTTVLILDDEVVAPPAPPEAPQPGEEPIAITVVDNLSSPTSIDFSPDGRNLYIAEQGGVIKVVRDGVTQSQPFLDISAEVNGTRDRGLLDIAVHPDFVSNPYVYATYTYDPPEVFQNASDPLAGPDDNGNRAGRISRFTADASTNYTTTIANSEVVLVGKNSTWENFNAFVDSTVNFDEPAAGLNPDGSYIQDFIPTDSQSHTVGSVEFGPDGNLYASIGDGASYNRVDPRAIRTVDNDSLSGKILRIDPITGEGLTDNPFYNGDPDANASKVYQSGLRNPFRITVADDGQVFIGDVGWTRFEEINAGQSGANFGWPFFEGGSGESFQNSQYAALPEAAEFYANANVTPSIFAASHIEDNANAIVLGDVYTGSQLPSSFQGDLFYSDLQTGVVNNVNLNSNGGVESVEQFTTGAEFVVQMVQGPDGNMYFVNLVQGTVGRWEFA